MFVDLGTWLFQSFSDQKLVFAGRTSIVRFYSCLVVVINQPKLFRRSCIRSFFLSKVLAMVDFGTRG